MTLTVLVHSRQKRLTVTALGMACDTKEIPTPLDQSTPSSEWLIGMAGFFGPAQPLTPTGELGNTIEGGTTGTAALVISGDRLFGIVSPNNLKAPAVWFAADLKDLTVTTEGTIGTFKKRPKQINLADGPWELGLGYVNAVHHSRPDGPGRATSGAEAALVEALSR
jgi:hypothetical protein